MNGATSGIASVFRSFVRPIALGIGAVSLFAVLLFALFQIVATHLLWQFQSSFTIERLDLGADQPPVFFKRENWGFVGNGERSGLTLTPGRCLEVNEESDSTFSKYQQYLVYKWDGTSLHLYEGETAPVFPNGPHRFPFPVVRHPQAPWGGGSRHWFRREGAARLDLTHNPTPCYSYWESMVPGLKGLKKLVGLPTEL